MLWDYIVVGGGLSGSVVSNRLWEGNNNLNILVVEAGPKANNAPTVVYTDPTNGAGGSHNWNITVQQGMDLELSKGLVITRQERRKNWRLGAEGTAGLYNRGCRAMTPNTITITTVAQMNADNRNVALTAGRVLGGGTVINGGAWIRGDQYDFDLWGETDLKVKGVEGLRVVDTSVFPIVITAHLQVATYAMAEQAAVIIASDRASSNSSSLLEPNKWRNM